MAFLQIAVSSSLALLSLDLFLFLFLSTSSSALLFPFASAEAALDVKSFLAFKSAVSYDPLGVLRQWQPNATQHPCNWTGISCSPTHPPRIVRINLSNSHLSGHISAHIGNLSSLQVLDLSFNAFSGYIPSSLGSLHRLHSLHLGGNSLNGNVPTHLGNLSSLRFLNLSNNNLRGGIPSSLGRLSNLENLSFSENSYLGGAIPPSLGGLKKLKMLLSFNSGHTGGIPLTLCNCSLLLALELDENQLTGTIPHCLGSLSRLYSLTLSTNSLHGEIPESIWNLTALQQLSLSANNLRGTVPALLGKLVRLQLVDLGFNHFVGSIPEQLANCTDLTALGLMSNHLSGGLPTWLSRFSKLQKLLLYKNNFTGNIPESLRNCTQLQDVELGENQLKGAIPPSLGQLSQLTVLILASNYLVSGSSNSKESVPAVKMLYNCSHLTTLYLDFNFLHGSLPSDIGMHWPRISYISLGYCNISGHIPESIGNFSSLLAITLEGNLLTGNIPHSWGNMKRLQGFSLSDNRLSGAIPWEITLLNRSVAYMYLQNNKLSGALPPFIGNLGNLEELDLSGNSFIGRIPLQLGNCHGLLKLCLSSNKFSGTIPPEVLGLRHIQTMFDLSGNSLTGDVPANIEGLTMAQYIDLSGNQLTGNIGFWIDQWLNAQYVNLSLNNFSGGLPKSIASNLTELQFIDISHNNFIGPISESLFNLSKLAYLDVSYNSFTGRVPCLGNFSSHAKFNFTHNPQLCSDCFSLPKCKHHRHQWLFPPSLLLGICLTTGVALFLWLYNFFLIIKRKIQASSTQAEMIRQFLWISPEEIQAATNNFSMDTVIGQGRHGVVYKGVLQGGEEVAIKVFLASNSAISDSTTFTKECEILRRVRHRNLIRIITTCCNIDFKALILPLMPHSLYKLLHEENVDVESLGTLFNLQIRVRVLQQLATALSYLHHDCSPCIVHCDVKPQNVLLDEEMIVHLSDFGIACLLLQGFDSSTSSTIAAIGSPGYIAPEYGSTGRVSTKGDVYSFGIVVLEVLTGLMPTHPMFEGDLTLSKWISTQFLQTSEKIEERREILKEMIGKGRRGVGREIEKEEEWKAVESLIKVGMMCSCERAEERPSMKDVEGMLYIILANLYQNENEIEDEIDEILGERKAGESLEFFL